MSKTKYSPEKILKPWAMEIAEELSTKFKRHFRCVPGVTDAKGACFLLVPDYPAPEVKKLELQLYLDDYAEEDVYRFSYYLGLKKGHTERIKNAVKERKLKAREFSDHYEPAEDGSVHISSTQLPVYRKRFGNPIVEFYDEVPFYGVMTAESNPRSPNAPGAAAAFFSESIPAFINVLANKSFKSGAKARQKRGKVRIDAQERLIEPGHTALEERYRFYLKQVLGIDHIQDREIGHIDLLYREGARDVICELKPCLKKPLLEARNAVGQVLHYAHVAGQSKRFKDPLMEIVLGRNPGIEMIEFLRTIPNLRVRIEAPGGENYWDAVPAKRR